MRRCTRVTLCVLAGALLAGAGATGGALAAREEPRKYTEVTQNGCSGALMPASDDVVERVVPRGYQISGQQRVWWEDHKARATCGMKADGKPVLSVTVREGGESFGDRYGPEPDGPRRSIGKLDPLESWSTRRAAYVTVPCTARSKGHRATDLHVAVRAEAGAVRGERVRGAVAKLAKDAAKAASARALCGFPEENREN